MASASHRALPFLFNAFNFCFFFSLFTCTLVYQQLTAISNTRAWCVTRVGRSVRNPAEGAHWNEARVSIRDYFFECFYHLVALEGAPHKYAHTHGSTISHDELEQNVNNLCGAHKEQLRVFGTYFW